LVDSANKGIFKLDDLSICKKCSWVLGSNGSNIESAYLLSNRIALNQLEIRWLFREIVFDLTLKHWQM